MFKHHLLCFDIWPLILAQFDAFFWFQYFELFKLWYLFEFHSKITKVMRVKYFNLLWQQFHLSFHRRRLNRRISIAKAIQGWCLIHRMNHHSCHRRHRRHHQVSIGEVIQCQNQHWHKQTKLTNRWTPKIRQIHLINSNFNFTTIYK